MRDIRLFQNGKEIPYAIEESYDEDSLRSGVTKPSDRSLYETVISGSVGSTIPLPARVPVERIAVRGGSGSIKVVAKVPAAPQTMETVQGVLSDEVLPVTLGANLQQAAEVRINAEQGRVVQVQMRRRSLCFTPTSSQTLLLYAGAVGIPAAQYAYARNFHLPPSVNAATSGPLLTNPLYRAKPPAPAIPTWRIAVAFALLLLFVWINTQLLKRFTSKA